ncbi:MAG TPA: hypothetical protein VNE39_22590 [Planctomycetota bacterium]|nr:hypothetical protein [Planctomycetota bacterium]
MGAPDGHGILGRMEKIGRAFAKAYESSFVPMLAIQGERLVLRGTGTLLAVADRHFVLTAAHVFTRDAETIEGMCIYPGGGLSKIIPVPANIHIVSDPLDLALMPLDAEAVAMTAGRAFLSLERFALRYYPPEQGYFVLHGYPSCWLRKDANNNPDPYALSYHTALYKGRTDRLEHYQQDVHILLEAPAGPNPFEGQPKNPPESLGGVSGCTVWEILRRGRDFDNWDPSRARIVAIQTSVYSRSGVLKATYARFILEALTEFYPDLRRAIRLHTG